VTASDNYLQIRYINKEGQEVVRVNREGDGVYFVPEKQLQNKADTSYFIESRKIDKGDIYLSEIELNVENGLIELPHLPVFRVVSPIYSSGGVFEGMIVINISAFSFYKDILEEIKGGEDIILTSASGRLLLSRETISNPSFVPKDEPSINIEFDWSDIVETEEAAIEWNSNGDFLVHKSVGKYFIVSEYLTEDEIYRAARDKTKNSTLIVGTITVLALLLFYLFLSRMVISKILLNKEAINKIADGDLSVEIKVSGKDEVSDVAHGINTLAKELRSKDERNKKHKREIELQVAKIKEVNETLLEADKSTRNILEDLDEEKRNVEQIVERRTKEVKDEREKLFYVTENISAGALLIDNKKKVIFINKKLMEIFNLKKGDKKNAIKSFSEYFPNISIDSIFLTQTDKKPITIPETEYGGRVYEIYIQRLPGVKDMVGGYARYLILVRDITDAKLLERAKSEFVSIASHQLRTPLTSLRLFSEMIANKSVGPLTSEQEEYMGSIQESTGQMIELVNDLLELSRIEAGKVDVNKEKVNITDFLSKLISEIHLLGDTKHCAIDLVAEGCDDLFVNADLKLLRQIVHNFITNAIRYSRPDACKVTVRLSKEGGNYTIAVEDEGIGIPENDKEKIFKRFFRTDKAIKMRADGSGLGLSVAKMLSEIMGGNVWFESEEGKGTTFFASFPLN